jgi:hypothetical protein
MRPKEFEIRKKLWKLYKSWKNQMLCHEIEPNPPKDRAMHEGDNPSFWHKEKIEFLSVLTMFYWLQLQKNILFSPFDNV